MKKENTHRKLIVRIILSILIVIGVLYFLERLLMPKYMGDALEGDVLEGTFVSEWYESDQDYDVVFVGDCELYENISPQVLFDEYGIHSYIRGSAQQLIWQSYYLMEETLSYEKPDVFVFNVLSMQYNEPQKESYNHMTLDYMKWSPSKVKSIAASMLEGESFLDYVFPGLRYHSRWNELTRDDLTYLIDRDTVTFNGYYMRCDTLAAENVPEGRPLKDYTFGDRAYEYLDKMVELCEENDITLILVKAPSLYPYWYDEWDAQMVDYATSHNLTYINFLDDTDEIGLDYNVDTYDGGLHLNRSGAEKLARYFGQILRDDFSVPDRRDDSEIAARWDRAREAYEAEAARQEEAMQ